MSLHAKVRPAIASAAAEVWGQLLDSKLQELHHGNDTFIRPRGDDPNWPQYRHGE